MNWEVFCTSMIVTSEATTDNSSGCGAKLCEEDSVDLQGSEEGPSIVMVDLSPF